MHMNKQTASSDGLRRMWMIELGVLCSPAFSERAVEALTAMLPHLTEYGDEYFCVEVLRLVARAPRRQSVPSYDEICNVFGEWWRARPGPARIAGPPPPPEPERVPATQEEIARVEALISSMKADLLGRTAAVRDRSDYAPLARPGAVPPPSGRSRADNPIVAAARRQQAQERAAHPTSVQPAEETMP
jgi:hypothetical protein